MNRKLKTFSGATICAFLATACSPSPDALHIVGQLESDRVELTAEFPEPVRAKHVLEGQTVKSGERLISQDTARIESAIAEAKAALAQSRARQDELIRGPRREQILAAQANVAGGEKELEFRRARYQRALQLFERDLASPDTRDQAKAALDAAVSTLEFEQARLSELLTGTTVEELHQAEQSVLQYEARLAALNVDFERHTISAPVDGLVDSILFEPGERPLPGVAVLVMLTGPQPYARVYVPEELRARVRPGTSVSVAVDGIEAPFDGRVRWIASEAAFTPYFALTEHDRGRLTYFAKIDILNSPERLPDGVPVEVQLKLDAGSR